MVSLLKIWVACPYMYVLSVSLIRCKNVALKKLHLKGTIKCFKEVKIDKWLDLSDLFLPIDCCVRTNGKPDHLFNGDISLSEETLSRRFRVWESDTPCTLKNLLHLVGERGGVDGCRM